MASNETFPQIAYPIRVILPIVYTIITVIVLIGNTLNFYSLCISTDRFGRKSIHVLIWNLITEGQHGKQPQHQNDEHTCLDESRIERIKK
ncbi:unnamed protein product [Rotaria sp. Silwood2]|nr:unnamed protein product [Rotaria sp. Silwood2]